MKLMEEESFHGETVETTDEIIKNLRDRVNPDLFSKKKMRLLKKNTHN